MKSLNLPEYNWGPWQYIKDLPTYSRADFQLKEEPGLYQNAADWNAHDITSQYDRRIRNTGQAKDLIGRVQGLREPGASHSFWHTTDISDAENAAKLKKYRPKMMIRFASKHNNPALAKKLADDHTREHTIEKGILDTFKSYGGHFTGSGNLKLADLTVTEEEIKNSLQAEGTLIVKSSRGSKKSKRRKLNSAQHQLFLDLASNPEVIALLERQLHESKQVVIENENRLQLLKSVV